MDFRGNGKRQMESMSSRTRRIPSLDGLRSACILVVLVAHSFDSPADGWRHIFWRIVGNGQTAVSVFFVISGYLITTLLLREWESKGTIDLRRFYRRRAFRILPAAFVYLGILMGLMYAGAIPGRYREWILSITFLRNYIVALGLENGWDWYTAHFWSLAVEEQFYIVWPVCLAALGPKRSARAALGVLVACPLLRIATYVACPGLRVALGVMTQTRLDTIMFGCVAAFWSTSPEFHALVRRAARARLPALAFLFVMIISPLLTLQFHGYYLLPFGYSLEGACIAIVALAVVECPATLAGSVLNHSIAVHLGLISYSFYLWQQLFCGLGLPASILPILLAAECSYWFIERPFLQLRDRNRGRVCLALPLSVRRPAMSDSRIISDVQFAGADANRVCDVGGLT